MAADTSLKLSLQKNSTSFFLHINLSSCGILSVYCQLPSPTLHGRKVDTLCGHSECAGYGFNSAPQKINPGASVFSEQETPVQRTQPSYHLINTFCAKEATCTLTETVYPLLHKQVHNFHQIHPIMLHAPNSTYIHLSNHP